MSKKVVNKKHSLEAPTNETKTDDKIVSSVSRASKKSKPNSADQKDVQDKLQQALKQGGFSIFRRIANFGFVRWNPPAAARSTNGNKYSSNQYKYRYKSLSKATAAEIRAYTRFDKPPPLVVGLHEEGHPHLKSTTDDKAMTPPVAFSKTLPKQSVAPRFPYGQIAVAPLFHAFHHCKVDKSSIDFVFGSSALEDFASGKTPKKSPPYLVMKIPGTHAIMLHYCFDFGQDYSQPGFQFERFMLGQNISDRHDVGITEHVQLMEIGAAAASIRDKSGTARGGSKKKQSAYRVLMTAEVDGVDKQGDPVEIKLSKKGKGVGRKVLFQMAGSGSLTLVRGYHDDKGCLHSVKSTSLAEIVTNFASHEGIHVPSIEAKILDGMEALQRFDEKGYFENEKVYQIQFNPDLELKPFGRKNPLLPPADVLQELFP